MKIYNSLDEFLGQVQTDSLQKGREISEQLSKARQMAAEWASQARAPASPPAAPKYRIRFFTGDYHVRQQHANDWDADLYLEFHFNSAESERANYSMVLAIDPPGFVSESPPPVSVDMAEELARSLSLKVGGGREGPGVKVVRSHDRGYGNLRHLAMPGILLEPCFVSNPEGAETVNSYDGRNDIARAVCRVIRSHFKHNPKIALSVGHIGKASNPDDRGASVLGGGTEAQYAGLVAEQVAVMLTTGI